MTPEQLRQMRADIMREQNERDVRLSLMYTTSRKAHNIGNWFIIIALVLLAFVLIFYFFN